MTPRLLGSPACAGRYASKRAAVVGPSMRRMTTAPAASSTIATALCSSVPCATAASSTPMAARRSLDARAAAVAPRGQGTRSGGGGGRRCDGRVHEGETVRSAAPRNSARPICSPSGSRLPVMTSLRLAPATSSPRAPKASSPSEFRSRASFSTLMASATASARRRPDRCCRAAVRAAAGARRGPDGQRLDVADCGPAQHERPTSASGRLRSRPRSSSAQWCCRGGR